MNQESQDIDLLYYIKIIVKRWKTIAVFTLIFLILTYAYISIQPKTYETQAVLKLGKVSEELIESKAETNNMLWTEAEMKKVLEKLGQKNITKESIKGNLQNLSLLNGKDTDDAQTPPNKEYIKITTKSANPQFALDITNEFSNLILVRHEKLFEQKIELRDQEIAQTKQLLLNTQAKLETSEEIVEKLESSAKLYPTSYSQGIGLMLPTEINSRDSLRSQVASLEQTIFAQEISQKSDKMTEIISEPLLPTSPTKYERLLPNLMIAIVLGILIGLLAALGKEWWIKNNADLYNDQKTF